MTFVIPYRLTAVPCPDSWLNKLARLFFRLLWKWVKLFCLLPGTVKGWARYALADDVQACTEAETSLALPGR